MDDILKKIDWDNSYSKRDNFLFYPHEEIIRFFSKYIVKQVGIDDFMIKHQFDDPKLIVFGCGIGRHLIFSEKMGISSYGVDISQTAINFAYDWCEREKIIGYKNKLFCCDGRNTPFQDSFFEFGVSHGVLDSMHIDVFNESVDEIYRILKSTGLFYLDLIGKNHENNQGPITETVDSTHEKNTYQTYFDETIIKNKLKNKFEIVEFKVISSKYISDNANLAVRYHLIIRPLK